MKFQYIRIRRKHQCEHRNNWFCKVGSGHPKKVCKYLKLIGGVTKKRKGCYNPVLYGGYCYNCKQKTRDKIFAGAGGADILGGVAIKKGVIKKVPKIAAKVIQVILRK